MKKSQASLSRNGAGSPTNQPKHQELHLDDSSSQASTPGLQSDTRSSDDPTEWDETIANLDYHRSLEFRSEMSQESSGLQRPVHESLKDADNPLQQDNYHQHRVPQPSLTSHPSSDSAAPTPRWYFLIFSKIKTSAFPISTQAAKT